jgi:hypothetical protein
VIQVLGPDAARLCSYSAYGRWSRCPERAMQIWLCVCVCAVRRGCRVTVFCNSSTCRTCCVLRKAALRQAMAQHWCDNFR